ncbi:MAG TPA: hypothetical protein QF882_07625 [Arenicellales bacterium]|nr:hypothetical protein [Arenicellales bacterium]
MTFFAGGLWPTAGRAQVGEQEVYDLTQQGWRIAETIERQETRAGIAPYTELQRVVAVTEYRLEKAGAVVVCEMRYDSQRDRQSTQCTPSNP